MIPALVLSVDAVCDLLGCKRRRVFQLLADGTLERAPRFGRELRIYRASVERALTPTPAKRRASRTRGAGRLAPAPAELLA